MFVAFFGTYNAESAEQKRHIMSESELRDLAKYWYNKGRADAKLEIQKKLDKHYIVIKKQKM